jgi:DNA-binding transcriptional MerR regulator
MVYPKGVRKIEYTVQQLSDLAGISPRTIRYYDEIGILKPARVNSSGYRIYGSHEVATLQQILFYRELGVELSQIKKIITDPAFDVVKALCIHREKLLEKRKRLDLLISNVEKTLAATEGRMTMEDKDRFQGFKQRMIEENENKFGDEVRAKFGKAALERANQKLYKMTKEQYDKANEIASKILEILDTAMETGDPSSELAQRAAQLHRQWLSYYWDSYSPEMHAGLAKMYVDDPRFAEYYDKQRDGMAKFLRDAILVYTGTGL